MFFYALMQLVLFRVGDGIINIRSVTRQMAHFKMYLQDIIIIARFQEKEVKMLHVIQMMKMEIIAVWI